MDRIELVPSLSHCIESAARETFWRLADSYGEGGRRDEALEGQIELLKAFLETMDFGKLRGESERYLTRGKAVKFVIYWEGGKPGYDMVVS